MPTQRECILISAFENGTKPVWNGSKVVSVNAVQCTITYTNLHVCMPRYCISTHAGIWDSDTWQ